MPKDNNGGDNVWKVIVSTFGVLIVAAIYAYGGDKKLVEEMSKDMDTLTKTTVPAMQAQLEDQDDIDHAHDLKLNTLEGELKHLKAGQTTILDAIKELESNLP